LAAWGDDTTVHHHGRANGGVASEGCLKAFGIDEAEAVRLQEAVNYLSPSPLISDARRVFDYGRQHEIPERAVDLYRRTRELSLSYWEQEAIRVSLNAPDGALRRLLEMKAERTASTTRRRPTSEWIASANASNRRVCSRSGRAAITRRSTSTPTAQA
jgi:hypothetical protein